VDITRPPSTVVLEDVPVALAGITNSPVTSHVRYIAKPAAWQLGTWNFESEVRAASGGKREREPSPWNTAPRINDERFDVISSLSWIPFSGVSIDSPPPGERTDGAKASQPKMTPAIIIDSQRIANKYRRSLECGYISLRMWSVTTQRVCPRSWDASNAALHQRHPRVNAQQLSRRSQTPNAHLSECRRYIVQQDG
jgi:hypothetical protein